jgi:hypothetical protein
VDQSTRGTQPEEAFWSHLLLENVPNKPMLLTTLRAAADWQGVRQSRQTPSM